jgi:hypothetical protein
MAKKSFRFHKVLDCRLESPSLKAGASYTILPPSGRRASASAFLFFVVASTVELRVVLDLLVYDQNDSKKSVPEPVTVHLDVISYSSGPSVQQPPCEPVLASSNAGSVVLGL